MQAKARKPRATPAAVWRTVAATARAEGIRGLWFKTLGEIGYRRAVLLECPLDQPLASVAARIPLRVELLDQSQLDEYNAFRRGADSTAARRQLEAGDRCYIARSEGRIIGACWSATRRAWSLYLSREIRLTADEVYLFDGFTDPQYRGKGVMPALITETHRFHRSMGMRRGLAVAVPENQSSIRTLIGYRPVGTIGYFAVGQWRHDFCRMQLGAAAPGEEQGRAASWDRTMQALETRGYHLDTFLAQMKRRAYLSLIERWGGVPCDGRVLKTDLFEEAMGSDAFLEELATPDSLLLGMDVSMQAATRAHQRDSRGLARYLIADACNLPLAGDSFSLIVSPSTLDHFTNSSDFEDSLRELVRILAPDGRLIITLDNRQNIFDPLLRLVHRAGLVPYYLGRSYTVNELRRELEAAGLTVVDTTAIVHHPRLTAVAAIGLAKRIRWALPMRLVQSALVATQRLQDTRFQYFSGCFVAALAVRSDSNSPRWERPA
jgi:SAM-dependent methyltransferase/GNAT superfamily N-acetyltransferase